MGKLEDALREFVQQHVKRAAADMASDVAAQMRDLRRDVQGIHKSLEQIGDQVQQLMKASQSGTPLVLTVAEAEAGTRFSPQELKAMRARFDLTQHDLARLLDVSPVTITAWETGKARPRKANLVQIGALRAKSQDDVDSALGREPVPDMSTADIRQLRSRLGLTQSTIADLVGISSAAVTSWETGKTMPSRESRRALAALAAKPRSQIEEELTRKGLVGPVQAELSAEDVRRIRMKAGFSQRQLAKKLGVSVNSVSNWETARTAPRRASIKQLVAMRDAQ